MPKMKHIDWGKKKEETTWQYMQTIQTKKTLTVKKKSISNK